MKTIIARKFSFSSAHFLPDYKGKCKNLHGHTWFLEIAITGKKLQSGCNKGMVMDFSNLKIMVKPLLEALDHTELNNIPGLENPTAENIAEYVWEWIKNRWEAPPYLEYVRVWESPESYAEVRHE